MRVLIDGVGALYSRPSITKELEHRNIRVARCLHSLFPWRMPFLNLRTHRKILVADGCVGFTGGMNIREGHLLESSPKSPLQDIHFQFEGPVVAHLTHMFAEDWAFTTRKSWVDRSGFPSSIPWAKLRRGALLTARTKTSVSCAGCCSVRSPAPNTVSASCHRIFFLTPRSFPP